MNWSKGYIRVYIMFWYTCMSNIGLAEKNIEAYCIFYNARKRKEELKWVYTIKFIIKYKKQLLFRRPIDKSL